jgi:hypothetical protein
MRVNARRVKNLPGPKTDVSDAAWLAQLGAHGLVRSSFVPPEPIRQLPDLTRMLKTIIPYLRQHPAEKFDANETERSLIGPSNSCANERLTSGQSMLRT